MTDRIDDYSSTRVPARDCVVSPIILILVGWPRLSRRIWVWVGLGLGGLAIAGLSALLLGSAWDGYIAANPGYRGDVANPPPASTAVGTQASLALAMLAFGYLVALIASFMRLRRTRGGWILLRALAALTPIPIGWLWLRHFHIPGQQPVLGLLTPSAASPGRVRVQQQRAARSRTFVPDPVHGLLRLRDLQLRADSQEAGGSTYKLTAYSDPSKARMSWWAGVR